MKLTTTTKTDGTVNLLTIHEIKQQKWQKCVFSCNTMRTNLLYSESFTYFNGYPIKLNVSHLRADQIGAFSGKSVVFLCQCKLFKQPKNHIAFFCLFQLGQKYFQFECHRIETINKKNLQAKLIHFWIPTSINAIAVYALQLYGFKCASDEDERHGKKKRIQQHENQL